MQNYKICFVERLHRAKTHRETDSKETHPCALLQAEFRTLLKTVAMDSAVVARTSKMMIWKLKTVAMDSAVVARMSKMMILRLKTVAMDSEVVARM